MKFSPLCAAALLAAFSIPAIASPGVSGSWYNPMQSGHGLAVDQLSPEAALMLWFTYDADGDPMPLYTEARLVDGAFTGQSFAPFGPRFGDFDPAHLVMQPWGRLSFEPVNCATGELHWDAPVFGTGETPMRPLRLLGCNGPVAWSPLSGLSGTWYHPQMQGLGVHVQVLDAASALVYWYSYDAQGQPLPLYIEARIAGSRLKGAALAPRGMRFGAFSRSDLEVAPFGNVEIEFQDCNSATLRYDTPLGKDQFALTRLTVPQEVSCTLPEARPEWAASLYTGTSLEFTFPDFETANAILLLNARDEVLLSTTGNQGMVRGQLRRDGDRTFMQVSAAFGAEYDKEIQRDPATGELFVNFIGPGDPGLRPFEITLRPSPVQPLPDPAPALPGTFGDSTAPYGEEIIVGADARFTYRRFWDGRLALEGAGRITRIDSDSGVFDFDLRVHAIAGSAHPDPESWTDRRLFGSGALLRGAEGDRLLLLGEGINQLPKAPATRFVPERVHLLLARRTSP